MAKSISELRKARQTNFEALSKQIESQTKKNTESKEDDRFWQCKTDESGNGSAVIRFLPTPQGEATPYVRLWSHGFKGPTGKWYIENSLTTLGNKANPVKDPVTELNNKLWDTKKPENEAIARKQKRKLNYYSNVLIISDPANPENEGKVKIFRYGQKIFDKLNEAMHPEFEEDKDKAYNPFDFWDGANFRLRITRKDDFANFDKSSLGERKPLSEDDDELQKIWDQCHSLAAIIAPDQFKTYEELEKRLNYVLGTGGSTSTKRAEEQELDEDDETFIKAESKKTSAKLSKAKVEDEEDTPPFEVEDKPEPKKTTAKKEPVVEDDSEDDLDYFRKLAED